MLFTNERVNNYRFYKLNILDSKKIEDKYGIFDLFNRCLGIHAARIGKPYISLLNKGVSDNLDSLYKMINNDYNFCTIRCMRKTLHMCTIDKVGILHHATKRFRIPPQINKYKNVWKN